MVDSPATPPNDADADGDGAVAAGPRRSTFVPPAVDGAAPTAPSAGVASPTDALADAIAAEYRAWVPVERQPPPAAPSTAPPVSDHGDSPLAGLSTPQAVPAGPAIPPPPQRASLPDDALLAVLDPDRAAGDTAALIDLFHEQLILREREARQLDEWEEQVRRTGASEADAIVTQVRSAYTGVIDVVPPAVAPVPPEPAVADSAPTGPARAVAPVIDPATLTGDALGDALADAPPPDTSQRTVATPPDDIAPPLAADTGPVPPPLIEPEAPAASPTPAREATDWEALLSAAPPTLDTIVDASPPAPSAESPDPTLESAEEAASVTPASASPPPPRHEDGAAGDRRAPSPPSAAPARGPRAFAIEQSALEPTPIALRAGRAVRQFWLWFAVNASVVTVAVGALIIADGASLRQAALATLGGVALSGLLLGVVTRMGRWSGQPTVVVGRATFGTMGNALPALIALAVRVLWAAALVAVLAFGVAEVLVEARLDGGLGRGGVVTIAAGLGAAAAIAVAVAGFGLVARLGAVVAPLAGVLVVGLIALTAPAVDLDLALARGDGPWALLVSGTVLVLSVVGLAWVASGGDLVRYQTRGASGAGAAVWASVGIALPAFALIAWGALLAASSPAIGEGLVANPVDTIARLVPLWYPVPLVLAVSLSLVMAASLSLYSGGFAVLALGVPAPRVVGVLIVAALTGGVLTAVIMGGPGVDGLLRDALVTLAVPVSAWAGIVGTETLLRRRPVDAVSLLQPGRVYPSVRWAPLLGLVGASAVGFGLIAGDTVLLGWAGYLWPVVGSGAWAESDAGVLIALVLGAVVAAASVPALRRIEAAESAATA